MVRNSEISAEHAKTLDKEKCPGPRPLWRQGDSRRVYFSGALSLVPLDSFDSHFPSTISTSSRRDLVPGNASRGVFVRHKNAQRWRK